MPESDYLREFEFLPYLPTSNLDDRSFEDLVQECVLRIPRYCPEWTNYNPGDPGITLIELFSWLVKQMLFRFNQVPRRHYVAFLELLGLRLQPPTPAHVDLTFHLVKAQNSPMRIPANTEVATVRTETEPAVIFITDRDLIIGQPRIHNLFTARQLEHHPQAGNLQSPFPYGRESDWSEQQDIILFEDCNVGNCFYIVLAPSQATAEDSIQGNVIALTFRGVIAGTTGINPEDPPLRWEAWNGECWQSVGILRQQQDDRTKGFSFHELQQQGFNPEQEGADVILHLPQNWQETDFGNGDAYSGYWMRCVYTDPKDNQGSYSYSPMIHSMSVRSIGGAISASECVRISGQSIESAGNGQVLQESLGVLLGISDGRPGQVLQLQGFPVLARKPDEGVCIKLPDGTIQGWQEVSDFGDSTSDDPHYVIDSLTGTVQFGPLIREPTQLKRQTLERSQLQPWGKQVNVLSKRIDALSTPLLSSDIETSHYEEWQYGKVPPIGAEIYMSAYRIGGGSRGNVQSEKLTVLKTSIPYVKQVTNYKAAEGGREGESLDEAVLRVPQILRTSQAAVTPEDFENLAIRCSRSIYRAHCLPEPVSPGVVRLLVVPEPSGKADPSEIDFRQHFSQGMHPDTYFTLKALGRIEREKLNTELSKRKPLGIQVALDVPEFVGVKVIAEVLLENQYSQFQSHAEIRAKLSAVLYRFLNPIAGGFEGRGWLLGRSLSSSDIVALLQDVSEVRYVGAVKLFSIRKHSYQGWLMNEFPELTVNPGAWGLISSWDKDDPDDDSAIDSGHVIQFME